MSALDHVETVGHDEISNPTYEIFCENDGQYTFGVLGITQDGRLAIHRFVPQAPEAEATRRYQTYGVGNCPWLVAAVDPDGKLVSPNGLTISPDALIDLGLEHAFHVQYDPPTALGMAAINISFGRGIYPPAKLLTHNPIKTLRGLKAHLEVKVSEEATSHDNDRA